MVGNLEDRLSSVEVRYRRDGGEFVDTTMNLARVDALAASVPVREFRWYKGRKHYSGWYWSSTTGGMVAYESLLELARILLADFDPDVCGIAAQPFQMAESTESKTRSHVPDLLLLHQDRTVTVVDVKPANRLDDPVVTAVFEWAGTLVRMRGWRFEVWTGVDAVLLANVRFLAGFRRPSVIDAALLGPLAEIAAAQGTVGGVERVARSLGPAAKVRPALLHLIWRGVFAADLAVPLSLETSIWLAEP
ncbi:TnsA-like heteromeric transposase endonuclease subunit [Glycomyces tritici]|uniref:TnsA-like heteromeric transposase endonuclease subunit n=1 Tax=Glycomyces tritici TaxID=2665176 RepID=A0ABT7YXS6_9ACTN|nr:TnsA-like heteromeric transposase endonuclease subunit [Glycomyces tritici]MDN3243033.1 TnsA-like heteromeric transposase endonuclease subunit [Glycomyces tritici]